MGKSARAILVPWNTLDAAEVGPRTLQRGRAGVLALLEDPDCKPLNLLRGLNETLVRLSQRISVCALNSPRRRTTCGEAQVLHLRATLADFLARWR
jgi:hypothetical protein